MLLSVCQNHHNPRYALPRVRPSEHAFRCCKPVGNIGQPELAVKAIYCCRHCLRDARQVCEHRRRVRKGHHTDLSPAAAGAKHKGERHLVCELPKVRHPRPHAARGVEDEDELHRCLAARV